jgi:O-antigen ligase
MKKKDLVTITFIILSTLLFNLSIEASIFLFKENINLLFPRLFHPAYYEHILLDLKRNRIYSETHLEIFIPLGFYILSTVKTSYKLFSLLIFPITLLSFISNFRSRILMSIASIIGSSFIFLSRSKVTTIVVIVALGISLLATARFMTSNFGFSVIDRLLLENSETDVLTIDSRINQYKRAIEVGLAHPLIGIGLGQFDYYISNNAIVYGRYTSNQYQKTIWTDTNTPHDIFFIRFAETGFLGLFSYTALLLYFAFTDWQLLKTNNLLLKTTVLCFWTLMLYALFNPSLHFTFLILFWGFRGFIYSSYKIAVT